MNIEDYDLLFIPEGRTPDRMRTNVSLVKLARQAFEKDKVVVAICHRPQVLIEAEVMEGRTVTCWKSVSTDLKNVGAVYEDKAVLVGGNLVTSPLLGDLPAFMSATLELLDIK
ncbi:MAG: hypothetical protein GWN31_01120 [Candidatus Thorarchaeota archaeon]|nr:hypothetical protein [Candidatus Thorarchaeota archaeon]NIW12546.1 hypothetical protein [Candidatus Thorarchaeota archaeon]